MSRWPASVNMMSPVLDACPLEPGPVDNAGCPDPDRDHGARIGEKIGRSGIPLQGAAKRNEHRFGGFGARIGERSGRAEQIVPDVAKDPRYKFSEGDKGRAEIKAYIDILFLAIVILLCVAKIVTN